MSETITMAHGSGGTKTSELIERIFKKYLGNPLFTADDANNYYENEVQEIISDFDNFDDVENFLKERREVYDAICALGEDEAVVTYQGSLYEEIKLHSMSYYFDTHHYAIGLIDWDNED